MSVILILIGFSILVAGGFLVAFLWSVNDGQYDDETTPAVRILIDSEQTSNDKSTVTTKSDKT